MTLISEPTVLVRRVLKIDKVILAIGVVVAVLALLIPEQAGRSVAFVGDALLEIGPFLLISMAVAAYARATDLDRQIAMAFSGHPLRAVVLAAAFGALSPFCSCGVVPLIAGLLAAGVPLAPVMAFWLASPLMDPQMFLLMLPVFGLEFTLAKLLAAFGIGLFAGLATQLAVGRGLLSNALQPNVAGCGGCGPAATLAHSPVVWRFWEYPARRQAFLEDGCGVGWFLLKWLSLAFLLESLMIAFIPAAAVGSVLGGGDWWTIPASVMVGIPAYLNGFAAIPTVSALIELGMAPAAGLGFMIAGGVTSIPASLAVFALVRRPVFLWYVVWGLSGSLLAAYVFESYTIIATLASS